MPFSPELELEAIPVVLVDQPAGHVPAVDRGDHSLLVLVDLRVALEPGEPVGGGLLPVSGDHGADKRREVGVGRGDRDLAFPLRLRKIEDRSRELGRRELCRIVHEAVHAERHSDPVAGRRPVPGRDLAEGRRAQLAQTPVLVQGHELRRVLGEIDVRRGSAPLLEDLVGKDDAVVRPHSHRDPGLLLERRHERLCELGVLAVVEDDRALPAVAASGKRNGGKSESRDRGGTQRLLGRSAHRGYTATGPETVDFDNLAVRGDIGVERPDGDRNPGTVVQHEPHERLRAQVSVADDLGGDAACTAPDEPDLLGPDHHVDVARAGGAGRLERAQRTLDRSRAGVPGNDHRIAHEPCNVEIHWRTVQSRRACRFGRVALLSAPRPRAPSRAPRPGRG